MRTIRRAMFVLAAVSFLSMPSLVQAQLPTIDVSNLAQNIAQVTHLVQQGASLWRQLEMMQWQYEYLRRETKRFNPSSMSSWRRGLWTARGTGDDIRHIGYRSRQLQEDFEAAYPGLSPWYRENVGNARQVENMRIAAFHTISANDAVLEHAALSEEALQAIIEEARTLSDSLTEAQMAQASLALDEQTALNIVKLVELQALNNDAIARRNAFDSDRLARDDSIAAAVLEEMTEVQRKEYESYLEWRLRTRRTLNQLQQESQYR